MRKFSLALVIILLSLTPNGHAQGLEGHVRSGGTSIRYRVFGDGEPLLLLNGGPGWSSEHMVTVAERLARTHRVVLFDQRGTGLSQPPALDSTTITIQKMVDDVEAVRRHLGFDQWIVMGHSFGGLLAAAYAARHPDPIRAMVLSAPAGATLDFLSYYPASLEDLMRHHEREAVAYWSDPDRMAAHPKKAAFEIVHASLGAFLYDRSRLPELLAHIDEDTWSIPASTLVWQDLMRIGFDVRAEMQAFERPVLVVQGRQDALGDHHAHEVADLFPNARLEIIEKAAHVMWMDQEERYYDVIGRFLEERG